MLHLLAIQCILLSHITLIDILVQTVLGEEGAFVDIFSFDRTISLV